MRTCFYCNNIIDKYALDCSVCRSIPGFSNTSRKYTNKKRIKMLVFSAILFLLVSATIVLLLATSSVEFADLRLIVLDRVRMPIWQVCVFVLIILILPEYLAHILTTKSSNKAIRKWVSMVDMGAVTTGGIGTVSDIPKDGPVSPVAIKAPVKDTFVFFEQGKVARYDYWICGCCDSRNDLNSTVCNLCGTQNLFE